MLYLNLKDLEHTVSYPRLGLVSANVTPIATLSVMGERSNNASFLAVLGILALLIGKHCTAPWRVPTRMPPWKTDVFTTQKTALSNRRVTSLAALTFAIRVWMCDVRYVNRAIDKALGEIIYRLTSVWPVAKTLANLIVSLS